MIIHCVFLLLMLVSSGLSDLWSRLNVQTSLYQAGLRSSGEMFGFHFRLCLSPGAHINVVSRLQKAHKLASIQKITDFPPQKVQSFLYPFSGLDSYLDRYWTQGYIPASIVISSQLLISICTSFRSVDVSQFQLFHPSLEDMIKAEKLFCSSPSHRIDYYTSAERMDHIPALKQPEVGETAVTF